MNVQEKKRAYNGKILQVGNGILTPLVFSINGSMWKECQKFYSRLAQLISEKSISISSDWILTKVCFGLLKSIMLCLNGSRTVCQKTAEFEIECNLKWFIQEDIWFQMKKRKFRAYFKTLIMTLYWKVNNFFYKRCFSVRQTLLLKMNSTTAKTTAKNLRQFFILEQILVFA